MFFKTTLTVPKIKDLVNSPNQKYQNIYDTLSHNRPSYTDIDLLPAEDNLTEQVNMKDELKTFLKKKLNTNDNNDVIGIESLTGQFSNF
jgi:hypothetical protein